MLPQVDYFDSVGNFMQGVWHLIAEGVAHIALLPKVLTTSADWVRVGMDVVPDTLKAVLPLTIGGVLLFRFIRM